MIQLKDVSVSFGARGLFAKVNLAAGERSRIGLVGKNGTGKTTLFRLLVGERPPDEGSIDMPRDLRIGYLPQEEIVLEEESVFDSAVEAFGHIHDIRVKMHELEQRMKDTFMEAGEMEKILSRYSRLQEAYAQDGYTFEARTAEVLTGLGFKEADFSRPCGEFSGGYQMRIALAKLLLSEPDLLLLDEPTNHLDLPSIEWLEGFIKNFKGALLISSHDRYFLDRVVDEIWDTDYGTITSYKGNYTRFTEQKRERAEQMEKERKKIAETRRHLQRFIDRLRGYPKKAALVRSRKKMLERLPKVELHRETKKGMAIRFPEVPRISGRVMALEGVAKSFGDNEVFSGVDLTVEPGDRIAFVGANGEGKTTLLRIIAGELNASEGKIWRSAKLQTAFYTQIVEERLNPQHTILAELEEAAPGESLPALRSLAGAFLFSGDDADKKVSVLSGGEKSRLALAKIILSPSNLLLLDEPTNHLDLAARDVLEQAIRRYPGTVVFAAHDRFLIDRLANKVVQVKDGKAILHLGNWTDFERWREELRIQAKVPATGTQETNKDRKKPTPKKKYTRPSKQENARQKRLLEEEANKTFAEIEAKEKEMAELELQMSNPRFYEDINKVREVTAKHRQLKQELDRLHEQLEGLLSSGEA
ncbi:ABC-F family ATP-binding cassette domain-containing protein [candidate division WOR-3 bacterium]|nr:ABC-F family ATP-binding cassette domain-containing protein [candidate division WOR-3 bacterium]